MDRWVKSAPDDRAESRSDPFALPSVTTGRFLLLIAAVVASSLFAYDYLSIAFGPVPGPTVAAGRIAALWMIVGVVSLLVVMLGVYLAMPGWIIRRRRLVQLSPDDASDLIAEVDRLAREAGLARPPVILSAALNPTVSAAVFGLPGRRFLRLNGGLVVQFYTDLAAFRATIRHELAHLRNRDVDQTYLTIATWYAFLLTALAPLAFALLRQPDTYLLGMSWRAIALTAVVLLYRNGVLRAREYAADARALTWDGPRGALRAVLARSASAADARSWSFGTHPPIAEREAALNDPAVLSRLHFWDAVGIGLVSTVAFGNVTMLINALLAEPNPLTVRWVSALVFAPAAAAGFTMGIWRSVQQGGTVTKPLAVLLAGAGLGCGVLIGDPLSLPAAITGIWGAGSPPGPAAVATAVVLLLGAAVLLAAWVRIGALAWLPAVATPFRRVAALAAIVATAFVLTVLLGYWTLLRDLNPILLALAAEAESTYQNLAASAWPGPGWLWTAFNHELVIHAIRQDPVVVAAVLLWLFPATGLVVARISGRPQGPTPSTRPLLVILGAVGSGAAYAAALLTYRAVLHTSPDLLASDDVLQVVFHWQLVGAVTAQAAIAAGVAFAVRSFRAVWALMAAFITGAIAVAAILGTTVVGGCFPAFSLRPGPCAWTLDGDFVLLTARWVLVVGAAAAVGAALLGSAAAAILHRPSEVCASATTDRRYHP